MNATPANHDVQLGMPALPAPDYPADVRARLEADAKEVIARYPGARSALLPLLHLVQAEEGHVTRTGIRFCAETARPDHRRGHRGLDLLLHVPPQARAVTTRSGSAPTRCAR